MTSEKLRKMLKPAVMKGEFTLSSGKKSNYYVNIKKVTTDPSVLKEIAKEMAKIIGKEKIDKIAGVAMGGVALAVALSLETGVPFLIARKEKKRYGTSANIEGELKKEDNVILVEDVTTTGGSVLAAASEIRKIGRCNRVMAVVDRKEGAEQLLKKNRINLTSLFKAEELVE